MAEPEFVTLQVEDGVGHDPPRPPQDERDQRAAAPGGAGRGPGGGEAGRRPRRRPLRRRAGLRRRRRHQGDVAAGRRGHGRLGPRADRLLHRGRPDPEAGHRRDHRLRARRRLRAGPVRGLPGARRLGRRSASPRSCSASSRAPAARSGWPACVGPAKAKDLVFTGRHVGAEEALEIGLADAVVPDDEVYSTARGHGARSSPPARRWRWPPRRRRSTRGSTCRWTRG